MLAASKMSGNPEVCANCGKEGNDTVNLKNCTDCFLVKYCSVDCQKIHSEQHRETCKERADELKDEKLYSQGLERPEGDFCPLCLLAIPFPVYRHYVFYTCCMKKVCKGCIFAAFKQGSRACPFCRAPNTVNDEEALGMIQKRVAARDPEAIAHLGDLHLHGSYGLEKNNSRAIELWTEAAELGSTKAQFKLGTAYYDGDWGVSQDKAKGVHFFELAAMEGNVESRSTLGGIEVMNGNDDRAVQHLLISAKMGHKGSLDLIKAMFIAGKATKAQNAEALKGYQDAVEEMKSPQRDEAMASGLNDEI